MDSLDDIIRNSDAQKARGAEESQRRLSVAKDNLLALSKSATDSVYTAFGSMGEFQKVDVRLSEITESDEFVGSQLDVEAETELLEVTFGGVIAWRVPRDATSRGTGLIGLLTGTVARKGSKERATFQCHVKAPVLTIPTFELDALALRSAIAEAVRKL
jgi:hypothetical protein